MADILDSNIYFSSDSKFDISRVQSFVKAAPSSVVAETKMSSNSFKYAKVYNSNKNNRKMKNVICMRSHMLRAKLRHAVWPIFMFLLFLMPSKSYCAIDYTPVTCGRDEQQQIMQSPQFPCAVRDSVVDLRPYVSNLSDVVHVIPDITIVARCGGNCHRPSHRCVPQEKRMKRIPIMMIMSRFPHGIHETQCGHVDVEEHLECGCGCPITAEDCYRSDTQHPVDKYFDSGNCRCLCRNATLRHECLQSNMEWDEANCRCTCPISSWQHCSTGYIFDYQSTCRCVPTSMTASLGLIAALIVLIVCILVTAIGFYTMYRRQTGLFRHSRQNRIVRDSQLLRQEEAQTEASRLTKPSDPNLKYDLIKKQERPQVKK